MVEDNSISYDLSQWRQWKIFSSVIGLILIPLALFVFFLFFAIDSTSLTRSELLVISSSSPSSTISSPLSLQSAPTTLQSPSPPPASSLPAIPPTLPPAHETPKTQENPLPELQKTDFQIPPPSSSLPEIPPSKTPTKFQENPLSPPPVSSLPVIPPAKTPTKFQENPLQKTDIQINRNDERRSSNITTTTAATTTCDIFNGHWVYDESLPYYPVQSCPYVDEAFDCHGNGRKDTKYLKYKWKPYDCDIPDFDGKTLLKLLSGKTLVIAGDSINRSMWVSLVCLIWQSVDNKTMLEDLRGKRAVYVKEYNCTVEFISTVFLVQREVIKKGVNESVRLDVFEPTPTRHYQNVDYIVFNTGHWWTNNKVNSGKNFFREGDHVHANLDLVKACKKAFRTWGKWLDENIDSNKTQVFFSGYSATHFRGIQWNSKGACLGETEPIMKDSQVGFEYHWTMKVLESQLKRMKTPVYYLNITKLTEFRKDGHTSVYRISPNRTVSEKERKASDCGHWCIPGVPDSWNFILYAILFNRQHSINGGVI